MKVSVHVEGDTKEDVANELREFADSISPTKKPGGKKKPPREEEEDDADVDPDDDDNEAESDDDAAETDDDAETESEGEEDDDAGEEESKPTAKTVLLAFQKYVKSKTGSPQKAAKILLKFKNKAGKPVKKVTELKSVDYKKALAAIGAK